MSDDLARDPVAEPSAMPAPDVGGMADASTAGDGFVPVMDRSLTDPSLPAADASLLGLVDRLASLLERSDLLELEVEAGGTGIVLRKAGALVAPLASGASPVSADPPGTGRAVDPAPAAGSAGEAASPSRAAVLAPLTGIFYASPSPGSPPFVDVGREVAVGQVIGLIEAMKLFNEIKSDKGGRVVRVVAENGALVKAKHPLIEVEPL